MGVHKNYTIEKDEEKKNKALRKLPKQEKLENDNAVPDDDVSLNYDDLPPEPDSGNTPDGIPKHFLSDSESDEETGDKNPIKFLSSSEEELLSSSESDEGTGDEIPKQNPSDSDSEDEELSQMKYEASNKWSDEEMGVKEDLLSLYINNKFPSNNDNIEYNDDEDLKVELIGTNLVRLAEIGQDLSDDEGVKRFTKTNREENIDLYFKNLWLKNRSDKQPMKKPAVLSGPYHKSKEKYVSLIKNSGDGSYIELLHDAANFYLEDEAKWPEPPQDKQGRKAWKQNINASIEEEKPLSKMWYAGKEAEKKRILADEQLAEEITALLNGEDVKNQGAVDFCAVLLGGETIGRSAQYAVMAKQFFSNWPAYRCMDTETLLEGMRRMLPFTKPGGSNYKDECLDLIYKEKIDKLKLFLDYARDNGIDFNDNEAMKERMKVDLMAMMGNLLIQPRL